MTTLAIGAAEPGLEKKCRAITFKTPLGWMAFAESDTEANAVANAAVETKADDERLVGVTFGHRSAAAARRSLDGALNRRRRIVKWCEESDGFASSLRERLVRFAEGEPVTFNDVRIDDSELTPFARRVTSECRRLGWGRLASYGALAVSSGRPGAARAVGGVMAANRWPIVVPCHRVVGAGKVLGGFSAPDGVQLKQRVLEMEGHCFHGRRVVLCAKSAE